MPVVLPPGRLSLAAKPSWIGSLPIRDTVAMLEVAAAERSQHVHGQPYEVGRERRQPSVLASGSAGGAARW